MSTHKDAYIQYIIGNASGKTDPNHNPANPVLTLKYAIC